MEELFVVREDSDALATKRFWIIVWISTFFIGLWSFLRFYRLQKRYPPGPVGVPVFGFLPFLSKEPHKKLWAMRERYGDVMSLYLGRKLTVVLNSWDAMKEVLTHPAALDRAPNLFDHIPRTGFITKNGREWVEQRRFCMSSARDLGVGKQTWEDIILDEVQDFVRHLEQHRGQPVEISHALGTSITSNIISFLFGRRFHRQEEGDKVQLSVEYSDVSLTYMGPSNATSVMPWLRKYLEFFRIAGYDRAAEIIGKFCNFLKEEIARHKGLDYSDSNDFINTYLKKMSNLAERSSKLQHYFSESNLEGNVNILFLGASDTIFSSLGWVLRLMAQHPDIQKKVYEELMEVYGKEGAARYEERHKIPYTFAVLMESQRFSSIVPLSTTRCANQDFSFGDFTIPKGAEIVANLWAIHHDPKYWDQPELFKPERFLQDDSTKLVKMHPSFSPFSIGRRNCPGETIAWMEILSYFSEIVKIFEISTPEKPQFEIINGLVARLKPQPLCFKLRSLDN